MSETSNPKYVVIVNDSHTRQASLGERNYSGRHYTVIAAGKYEDIEPLAKKLNAETPSINSGAAQATSLKVDERLAPLTPEEVAAGVVGALNKNGKPANEPGDTFTAAASSTAFDPVTVANQITKAMRRRVWP